MSVYYVHAPDLALIKIGFSVNPGPRLVKMQVDSPTRLLLLAIEDGGRDVESARHHQFATLRRRGEWFDFAGALRNHIESLPRFSRPKPSRRLLPGPLGAWLSRNSLSQDAFASMIGSTGATISRICSGVRQPTYFVRAIYDATNGEVDANDLFGLPARHHETADHEAAAA